MQSKKECLYKEFKQTSLWKIIEKSLAELIDNQDIEITTRSEYVIGYLCKKIAESEKK